MIDVVITNSYMSTKEVIKLQTVFNKMFVCFFEVDYKHTRCCRLIRFYELCKEQ